MSTNNHTAIGNGAAGNSSVVNSPLGQLDAAIGNLTALTTTVKTSAVAALNELDADMGAAASTLTTTAKNFTGAINELDAAVDVNTAAIGTLASLTTTVKSSLVGATNEINDLLNILYLEIVGQMDWWELPQRTCLAAYNPQQAASYSASKTNLAGGAALIETVAPSWDGMRGWIFSGTEWLDTNIAATEGYTMVVRSKGVSATKFICGSWNSVNSKGFCLAKSGASRQWFSGGNVVTGTMADFDVMGVAGAQPYNNGVAVGSALAAWGYTITPTIGIGKLNGYVGNMLVGDVLQFALYSGTLSAVEMGLIYSRINAIRTGLITFGDSVTAGTGASDAAHRYANLLATAWSKTLLNAGIGGTVLQNTDTLASNGRDRYLTAVANYRPERVVILYGLNDLRYNGVNFSVANYENDLGEVVAGLISSGLDAQDILIGSPPAMKSSAYASYAPFDAGSAGKQVDYATAAQDVATLYGTRYCDVYAYMLANGGDTLIDVDGVHPNDNGHQAIADAIAAAWV